MRTTAAAGGPAGGTLLNRTVAFIGESGVTAMRAVSLRGPTRTPARLGIIGFSGGTEEGFTGDGIGPGPAEGFKPDGGDRGGLPPAGGGRGAFETGEGGKFSAAVGTGGAFEEGVTAGGSGRAAPGDEAGAGGLTIGGGGGRWPGVPPVGGKGLGATEGGGRTGAEDGRTVFSGVRNALSGRRAAGGPGGRLGRLIRAVPFSTGTVGRCVVRRGRVIRTVSFFGSFKSAIRTNKPALHKVVGNVSVRLAQGCQSPILQASKS